MGKYDILNGHEPVTVSKEEWEAALEIQKTKPESTEGMRPQG